MKRKCNNCEHKCHCVGQGYNVSETFCDVCDCVFCEHEVNQPTEETMSWFKKQWQKFIDWVFKGFYKD